MSRTMKTRPQDVQEADPKTKWVHSAHNFPTPVVSGLGSMRGHGKRARAVDTRRRRQRDRQVKHNAMVYADKFDDALQPWGISADRRTIRAA